MGMASRTLEDTAKMLNWGFGIGDRWMYAIWALILIALPAAHIIGYSYVSYMLLTFLVGLIIGRITAV